MALDLRELLRAELRTHPRVLQQGLFGRPEDGARLAASLPPLVPFAQAQYAGADWMLDWDHRLPSRQTVLRLYAHYTEQRRDEAHRALEARLAEIGKGDLYPEFDVPDLAGLPADEIYEAEVDLGGSPSRLRLISEWRREIQPEPAIRAVEIVRGSDPFRELKAQAKVRPPALGDLEPAEWSPPCESGHVRWGIDVWYLMTFNGMVGEGRAFLVDLEERSVVRERDFQFRAG
jgi:hypothetical protein